MLEHGGRLRDAARRWNIALTDWVDLSTGISPWPYPVPPVPADTWQRLPESDDGLEATAADYYRVGNSMSLLPLPGSQAAIQTLPKLLASGRVSIPAPIYSEHPAAWQAAGHTLVGWDEATRMHAEYAVVCNPTNPTGRAYTRAELIERAATVELLVVDEAFLDAESDNSMIGCDMGNVVVLRSLGKFFGLAGARVGFAIGAAPLLASLTEALGPWAVGNPARWAARHALADGIWQIRQRERLQASSARLAALLAAAGFGDSPGTALFRYVETPRAAELYEALAGRGILVRLFGEPAALRFGLPAEEAQWHRLEAALREIA